MIPIEIKLFLINKKNKDGDNSIINATYNDNIEIIKLLIEYANENNIILEINEKNKNERYPFIYAASNNNIEMVQLLIEYANKNDIVLKINEKSKDGDNPIFWAIDNNNIEMFKLLIEYSVKKKIKIIINEEDIEEIISKNLTFVKLKNISEISFELIKLIYLYKNKNVIEVVFSENSYILKKFIKYLENEKMEKERIEKDLENKKMEKERIEKDLENEKRENKRIENENKLLINQMIEVGKTKRNNIMNRKNTKRDDKDTILTYEYQRDNIEEVKKLIHCVMDINEKNENGDTPSLIAYENSNIELIKSLLKHKEVKIKIS